MRTTNSLTNCLNTGRVTHNNSRNRRGCPFNISATHSGLGSCDSLTALNSIISSSSLSSRRSGLAAIHSNAGPSIYCHAISTLDSVKLCVEIECVTLVICENEVCILILGPVYLRVCKLQVCNLANYTP